MAPDDASIPQWAADLRVSVAKIESVAEVTSKQLPDVLHRLEGLQANSVPMHEHLKLMNSVERLQERDLGARDTWNRMVPQVETLWNERARVIGAITVLGVIEGIISVLIAARAAHVI